MTTKARVLKQLKLVRENVSKEIAGNASRGHIAAGLSSEGYAGGYRQAIDDIEAALSHGYPSNVTPYWDNIK